MLTALPWRHGLLALLVVAIWGSNFVAIRLALDVLPPFLFAGLRFLLVALPAIFFCRRPEVHWGNLAAYGLLVGAGQFGLLYFAMQGQISPGLASLVIQSQVVFTIGLAMLLSGERPRLYQGLAVLLAVSGIAVIAGRAGGAATPLGLALVLGAGLSWAGANLLVRQHSGINMLAYVVWASPFSVPPLFMLSVIYEGWPSIQQALSAAGPLTWGLVLWQSIGNSMFGFAVWGWLLSRYPAATVAPMALLVPIFGIGTAAWWLHEPLPGWKIAAACLVLAGLALNLFGAQLFRKAARH